MSEEVVDRGEASPRLAEQITRDPPKEEEKTTGKKAKDPKKVASGKKLAEYNKKAKEALAREMKREEKMKQEEEQNENTYSESKSWMPELSFTTVLSIVGIGFTAFDLFMRYKNRIPDLSQIPQPFQAPPIKVHNPQTNTQAPPLDRPKIGMM